MLRGHTRASQSVDDGEIEAWWDCRTQHVGRRTAIIWVGNTWNSVKGEGHLLEKSDGGSGRRGSPSARPTRPPIPDDTCIGDIAADMADVMLSTAAELVPCSKRPRGAQGWCAGPGVEAEMNAAWQQREEARRHLRAEPHNSNLRRVVKMAGKKLREVRKAAVLSFCWDFVRKLETRTREGDQAGFYKHLKTMNLEGKRDHSSAYVKDENGVLLRDVELIRERWVRWFHTLLDA